MTKWKIDEIAAEQRSNVEVATADWSADRLREKLADILTAVYPIRYTLSSLVDNPHNEGQVVTSGLWPETFGKDRDDLEEPWGVVFSPEAPGKWDYVAYKWSEPLPEGMSLVEARFEKDVFLHPDTPILSVWQYATACSIFAGSFDATDIAALCSACQFDAPNA